MKLMLISVMSQVAAKMFPLLQKFGLVKRTYAYTMDGGANLATTARVLDHSVPWRMCRVCVAKLQALLSRADNSVSLTRSMVLVMAP